MSNELIGSEVLSELDIKTGVEVVAEKLNQQFANQTVVIVSVVPGGIVFTADLIRKLTFDVKLDYLSCIHTPGDRQNTSPIVYHRNVPIENQHVVLVDDAIESGGTMKRVSEYIAQKYSPRSLSIATLFVKPSRVDIPFTQYFAYEMESDDMLVGYGLPWMDKYRNLPSVSKLNV